jgi:hypothetical protein
MQLVVQAGAGAHLCPCGCVDAVHDCRDSTGVGCRGGEDDVGGVGRAVLSQILLIPERAGALESDMDLEFSERQIRQIRFGED